ncbi:hypothetical protein DCAR_0626600 [Daucus carota subsp. sativus]|uniref:Uncharacterized protein n=1 Tax=Daucus carota subsp. sativus TaxID=79200 RepID=A0AAF0XIT2_DAUCS|nr:hypothetical protein DCAR_0626600 [Daucus carota subsp. sativus]
MDYPYGHPLHNRHDNTYPPPPNTYPPPPQVHHTSHQPGSDPFHSSHHPGSDPFHSSHRPGSDPYPPPPQAHYGGGDAYPPYPPPQVEVHVYPPGPGRNDPYSSGSNVHHVAHESRPHGYGPSAVPNQAHGVMDYLSRKPTVRVYTKADTNHSLTIHDGKVTLARSDPNDPCQHWVKDEKYSTKVKDEQGFPCFSLVNKATGQALKHSVGAHHPVQLIPYVPDKLDESILWTLSLDTGEGYRTIRMVNNIRLNVDAFKDHNNSVHDGTTIGLWEWIKGENQRWKIVPY